MILDRLIKEIVIGESPQENENTNNKILRKSTH